MTDVPAHTIVVGVDGSATSDRAVAWAAEQARLEDRDLTLVHATGIVGTAALLWMDQAGVDSGLAMDGIRQDAEALLQEAADRVAELAPEVRVRGVVADVSEITRAIAANKANVESTMADAAVAADAAEPEVHAAPPLTPPPLPLASLRLRVGGG